MLTFGQKETHRIAKLGLTQGETIAYSNIGERKVHWYFCTFHFSRMEKAFSRCTQPTSPSKKPRWPSDGEAIGLVADLARMHFYIWWEGFATLG